MATDRTWPFSFDRVNIEPNLIAVAEASQLKINSYQRIDATSYKDFLHRGYPIIIGFFTGRMFWKMKGPLANQLYKPINTEDNRKFRGHAATIIGYDDTLLGGSWIIANSLGLTWGDHGLGLLPYDCCVDIGESYVITQVAGKTPEKKFLRIDK